MTPEIISQLRARMHRHPRSLVELHSAAAAVGSAWSEDQVALLLACLPDVEEHEGRYRAVASVEQDPTVAALLQAAGHTPVPAPALIRRMPRGVIVTPAALCEIARRHPELVLVAPNRIRLRDGGTS